jgi:hypothetical protein
MDSAQIKQVWAENGFEISNTGSTCWAAMRQVDGVEFWLTDDNESREPDPSARLTVGAYVPNSGEWLEFTTSVDSLEQALPQLAVWAAELADKLAQ